ncbi:hypothetical protein [Salibacter sp.]|uniref:hypothetical protein n=1 Tax=Salibacter sp. TaxID=2010995 RepID=UPI00286FF486|nr:hypothetical protein [Salibacter sp.]MDR9399417.1 hypothetical protein [Salibacter sp.]MDR9488280.1 hypothetical protein [Salibacter sp.]
MIQKLAKFISVVFHPLIMPTYGVLLLFNFVDAYFVYTINEAARTFILSIVFLNTFLLPVGLILYLLRTKRITDIQVTNREERWLPIILTTLFYVTTYYLLDEFGMNRIVMLMLGAAILSIIAAFFINLVWKISMHMVGLGGLAGVFYGMAQVLNVPVVLVLLLLILVSGIVGYARLTLKQHTLNQLLAGAVLGFIVSYLVFEFGVA